MHDLSLGIPNTSQQESKSDQDTAQGEVGIKPSKLFWSPTIKTLNPHNGKVPSHYKSGISFTTDKNVRPLP